MVAGIGKLDRTIRVDHYKNAVKKPDDSSSRCSTWLFIALNNCIGLLYFLVSSLNSFLDTHGYQGSRNAVPGYICN
jgi:hypothetical protein